MSERAPDLTVPNSRAQGRSQSRGCGIYLLTHPEKWGHKKKHHEQELQPSPQTAPPLCLPPLAAGAVNFLSDALLLHSFPHCCYPWALLQVQETTPGPGLHNRHFKYTATGGTFMAKIAKADSTLPHDGVLDNFFAEQTGLEVHGASLLQRHPIRAGFFFVRDRLQLNELCYRSKLCCAKRIVKRNERYKYKQRNRTTPPPSPPPLSHLPATWYVLFLMTRRPS